MIHLLTIRSHKLKELQAAVSPEWELIVLREEKFGDLSLSVIALKADTPIPKEFDIPVVLASFPNSKVCPICLKQGVLNVLPLKNKIGYCLTHRRNYYKQQEKLRGKS